MKHDGADLQPPFEYFCEWCHQLRLCLDPKFEGKCGNCGSDQIVKGVVGSLDKDYLIRQCANKQ